MDYCNKRLGLSLRNSIISLCIIFFTLSCSSAPSSAPQDSVMTPPEKSNEKSNDKSNVNAENLSPDLTKRVSELEEKLTSINDKLTSIRISMDNLMVTKKIQPSGILTHPAQSAGSHPAPLESSGSSDAGFLQDEPIQKYRGAMIVMEAQKYSEAVLAFSDFLKEYADHPLAGSAQ